VAARGRRAARSTWSRSRTLASRQRARGGQLRRRRYSSAPHGVRGRARSPTSRSATSGPPGSYDPRQRSRAGARVRVSARRAPRAGHPLALGYCDAFDHQQRRVAVVVDDTCFPSPADIPWRSQAPIVTNTCGFRNPSPRISGTHSCGFRNRLGQDFRNPQQGLRGPWSNISLVGGWDLNGSRSTASRRPGNVQLHTRSPWVSGEAR
jgi:hypothetical protein